MGGCWAEDASGVRFGVSEFRLQGKNSGNCKVLTHVCLSVGCDSVQVNLKVPRWYAFTQFEYSDRNHNFHNKISKYIYQL